ncbi:MAG: hypothetical protein JWP10_687 [Nocardioidaceae bacterium]|nr:hypothetical protein [Nocardioidaceae bacterium]
MKKLVALALATAAAVWAIRSSKSDSGPDLWAEATDTV